jgi:hypothetical protein
LTETLGRDRFRDRQEKEEKEEMGRRHGYAGWAQGSPCRAGIASDILSDSWTYWSVRRETHDRI